MIMMMTQRKIDALVYYVCYLLLCSYQVSAESVITLVTRNVTDSFRVGEEGCKNKESICTSVEASCQDDGLCRCGQNYPHFRNPVVTIKDLGDYFRIVFGHTYGCNSNDKISAKVTDEGPVVCLFKPFTLLSADAKETFIEFTHIPPPTSTTKPSFAFCRFSRGYVKYPVNNTMIKKTWLNETYVDLSVSDKILKFKWRRSVSELQGLIVKIMLYCRTTQGVSGSECFEGKISGTWIHPDFQSSRNGTYTTLPKTTTVKRTIFSPAMSSSSASTDHLSNTQTAMFSIATTPTSKKQDEIITIAAAAAAGGGVLLILIIFVCCCFVRRRKRKRKSTSEVNYEQGIANPEYCITDQDEHDHLYDSANIPKQKKEIEHENIKGVMYAVSDKKEESEKMNEVKSGQEMDDRIYDKPEVPGAKKEIEREEVNGVMYTVSDKIKKSQEKDEKEINEGEYDKPEIMKPKEIERKEVNGVMYAVSDKKKKLQEVKKDEIEMSEGVYAEPEVKEPKEIERKEVNGVMYAISDKMKKPTKQSEKDEMQENDTETASDKTKSLKEKELVDPSVDMDDVDFIPPPNYDPYELEDETNTDGYESVKDIV